MVSLLCVVFSFLLSAEILTTNAFQPKVPSTSVRLNSQLSFQNEAGDVRQEWLHKSLVYYSKLSREERRRAIGQIDGESTEYHRQFNSLAIKHYFALKKIKDGKLKHAELIYRRIVNELLDDTDCDHAKVAVTTLLLALHLQRTGDAKKTRSVFLNFFRIVGSKPDHECACSAKVLQAFALFEMKQGNSRMSLKIVKMAVKLDSSLQPVLNWKQFRDAQTKEQARHQASLKRRSVHETRSPVRR